MRPTVAAYSVKSSPDAHPAHVACLRSLLLIILPPKASHGLRVGCHVGLVMKRISNGTCHSYYSVVAPALVLTSTTSTFYIKRQTTPHGS